MSLPPLVMNSNGQWRTPRCLFDPISNAVGGFDLDLCASQDNTLCKDFYSRENSCLDIPEGVLKGLAIWCNPYYSTSFLNPLSEKLQMLAKDNDIMLLVPMKLDQSWVETLFPALNTLYLIRGRINFVEDPNAEPRYSPTTGKQLKVSSSPQAIGLFHLNNNPRRRIALLDDLTGTGTSHWRQNS